MVQLMPPIQNGITFWRRLTEVVQEKDARADTDTHRRPRYTRRA